MTDDWAISGIPVHLRRSPRRRTVALQVRPGEITVYAPARVPLSTLREIVAARREWIERHLEEYAARPAPGWTFADGSTLPFLGGALRLTTTPGLHATTRTGGALLVPPGTPEQTRERVERWTRAACVPHYRTLVEDAATHLGARDRLGRVQVGGAQYRWGSCSAQGDIRVHWKLSRAPRSVLEYVAVHEAAHLLEFNHSRAYWALVERALPDYLTHRDWLKEHGHTL